MSFGKANCIKKNVEVKIDRIKLENMFLYKLRNLLKLLNSKVLKFPDSSKINPFFENSSVRLNLLK